MANVGRPLLFSTPEDLQSAIDEYLTVGVKQKTVIVGKGENLKEVIIPVPTISGLCYYLGFESRQSFYAYEQRPEFCYTIKRARLFIEQEYEEMLAVGNTTGAIFALKNFGWTDKTEVESTGEVQHNVTFKIIE